MEKITIKSLFGNIIFEHKIENNTLLKTLNEALKIGADLSDANLSNAKQQTQNYQFTQNGIFQ